MAKKITDEQPRVHFDCSKCPAFCCTVYERVAVKKRDVTRLAKHFGVSYETAERRYTKLWEGERVLRRTADEIFHETCIFLNQETRGCSVYHARPGVCREYPDRTRCAYYDLMQYERRHQNDPNVVPLIQLSFRETKQVEVSDEHGTEKIWEWEPKS